MQKKSNKNTQMVKYILTSDIKDRIEKDQIFKGFVAASLGVSTESIYRILKRNDSRLTQKNVLETISKYTALPENLIIEVSNDNTKVETV